MAKSAANKKLDNKITRLFPKNHLFIILKGEKL